MSKKERYLYPIELIVVMPKVKVNNMVKFCTLYLLASGPKHGYELMKELEDKFGKNMFNRFGDLIDIAIEPRLTARAHCNCKVFEGGHTEKVKGKALKFCCMHCASSYKRHHN